MLDWFRRKSKDTDGDSETVAAPETIETPEAVGAPEIVGAPASEDAVPAPESDRSGGIGDIAAPGESQAPTADAALSGAERPIPGAIGAIEHSEAAADAPTDVASLRAALASELAADAAATPESAYDPFATTELAAIEQSLEAEDAGSETVPVDADAAFAQQATTALPEGAAAEASSAALPLEERPPSEIDLGPDRRGGVWVWVGLVTGMLVAAGAIGYAWWYTTARPIPVPVVIGKSAPQAVQQLNDLGLRLGRVSEEPTDTAAVGEIIDQQPKEATNLKPGDLVSLVVAASPQTTEVPEVTGRMHDEALVQLASSSLTAKVVESYDTSMAAGMVISQIPTAGADLKPGSMIALAVSRGPIPTSVRMPRLLGLKQTDADALLKANNLRGQVFHSYNASVTVGEVYAQAPVADTSVLYDSWTQYLVSDGAGTAPVTLPSVVGATRKVAEQRIKARNLKVVVKQSPHSSVPKGQVISQIPSGNAKVARGATVGIIVSRGSTNTTSVPDLSGLGSTEASASATNAGFEPVLIDVPIAGYSAGLVFAQWPEPGTQWTRRFPVMIVTARLP